eukprot:TRINITY_DN17463_c0_g1_i1.p1 TRINITY_DN17463_c0_g1~~TRINITY_DN17463_c0_g1_i1.p1  ORF type:complete len:475 (+),score=113.21 TRINITY_DN17463_c0_g1_i1:66-1490(+)
MSDNSGVPSCARLLAAGQRNETLNATPVYGRSRAANIPGKGRGLVAKDDICAGNLLLLEPAVASGETYAALAEALRHQTIGEVGEAPDDLLLEQLLSLCVAGQAPTEVATVPDGSEDQYLRRCSPSTDEGRRKAAHAQLRAEGAENADEGALDARLLERLERAARANAFRSASDPLGGLAWHSLAPQEQRAIAEAQPDKLPQPRLWLFLRASLMNHSEAPNACWLVAGGMIAVRAARDIAAGEEILVSYWPDVDAADAAARGLPEAFGMPLTSLGPAPELEMLDGERGERLAALKRLPGQVAEMLNAAAGTPGADLAAVFDEAVALVSGELGKLEKEGNLPSNLRAFLEPRMLQAQLMLQQSAIKIARGDAARGKVLRNVALTKARDALKACPEPWGKRVLLRLLFAIKGALRPAPAEMLRDASDGAGDFSIQLAAAARAAPEELDSELRRAVAAVFGDEALLSPVLSKCGVTE